MSKKNWKNLITGVAIITAGALYIRLRAVEKNYYRKVGELENTKDLLAGYQRLTERQAFSLGKLSREKWG